MLMSHHAFLLIFYCSGQTIKAEARLVDTEMPSSSGGLHPSFLSPLSAPLYMRMSVWIAIYPLHFLGEFAQHMTLAQVWHLPDTNATDLVLGRGGGKITNVRVFLMTECYKR